MSKKRTIQPEGLFHSTQYGFSQVVVSEPGKMVFISGQVAWDENEKIHGENDLETQTRVSIEKLERAVESAGGSLEDIVMLRIYKVNFQAGDGPVIGKILREKFGTDHPPASTWISVNGLANPDFMIEIEAQAIVH